MMNKSITSILLFLAFCLSYYSSVYAEDINQRLQNHLAKLDSFSADFSQRIIVVDQARVKPSSGSMRFKRPGKFIWNYKIPYQQKIISDGKQLWIYDLDLEQVTVRPLDTQVTKTPISILDDPTTVAEHYKIELLSENGNEVDIQLTPLVEDADFNYVVLSFNDEGLLSMDIYDSFDHYNNLTFENFVSQADIADEMFDFNAPMDVDIIYATE